MYLVSGCHRVLGSRLPRGCKGPWLQLWAGGAPGGPVRLMVMAPLYHRAAAPGDGAAGTCLPESANKLQGCFQPTGATGCRSLGVRPHQGSSQGFSESWWRGSRKRGRRWLPPPLWVPGGLPTPWKRHWVPPQLNKTPPALLIPCSCPQLQHLP